MSVAAMLTMSITITFVTIASLRMLVEIELGKLVSRFIAMRMAGTCTIYRALNVRHEDKKEKQVL